MPESGVFMQSRATPGAVNGAADRSRWGCADLVSSGPTGQPIHQLLFFDRDVLDDGWYDDEQHDCRCLCRAWRSRATPTRHLDGDVHQSSDQLSGSGTTTTTLPSPWANRDVGSPALAGSASASGGTFTVTAGGSDIWGTSRSVSFRLSTYARRRRGHRARGLAAEADRWSKAGVMIRESLTAGSRYAFMMVIRQRRGGDSSAGSRPATRAIARTGQAATLQGGSVSSVKGAFSPPITRPTARPGPWSAPTRSRWPRRSTSAWPLTSHDTAQRATATFTNLTARTPTTGTNQPPTVSITSPASGATFTAPATITVTAAASDTDGTITRVDFYRGGLSSSGRTPRTPTARLLLVWLQVRMN